MINQRNNASLDVTIEEKMFFLAVYVMILETDIFNILSNSLGIPGTIFNGICDWVYEEEVFSDTKAMYFSPDGKHLAWVEFNDTEVDVMPLQVYGQPGRIEFQYPIPTPLRYIYN